MPKASEHNNHRNVIFDGYSKPNYTQVPDELFDEQLPHLSGAELKVLLYIMRRTFGFKKDSDDISFSQITDGITTRDGRALDHGTGLSRSTAQVAIKGLIGKRLIHAARHTSRARGFEATTYSLNLKGVPCAEIRHSPMPKSDPALDRKSVRQETVSQDTDQQQTDLLSISKGSHSRENVENPPKHAGKRSGGRPKGLPIQSADQPSPSSPTVDDHHPLRDPTEGSRPGGGRVIPAVATAITELAGNGRASAGVLGAARRSITTPRRGSDAAIEPRGRRQEPTAAATVIQDRYAHLTVVLPGRPRTDRSGAKGTELGDPRRSPEKTHPGAKDGPSNGPPRMRRIKATPYIAGVMEDISAKLHDEHPRSTLTRVMGLYEDCGLDEATFVNALYEMRSLARQSHVKKRSSYGGLPNRMPFFLACLADRLGLEDHQGRGGASS